MVGISAMGAYMPLFRMGMETAGWKAPGERPWPGLMRNLGLL
jgi:hypothetical protein